MDQRIGVAVTGQDTAEVLSRIRRLETLGVDAAWLTTGGAGRDSLTVFAAAATQTERIMLGTSIMPTWPRHPVVAAQQVRVLAELAPGRFRLGVGPSHRANMQRLIGTGFNAPLGHLREYVQILKALVQEGEVDYHGKYYHATAQTGVKLDVPVMASALRQRSFELCGEEADGAITWLCPVPALKDVALPAMQAGAARKGRAAPPLIAHAPVCVHDNPEEVKAAMREQMGYYPASPFYNQMLQDSGYPEVAETNAWTDRMIAGIVISGSEGEVAERLKEMFAIGAREVVLSPLMAGAHKEVSLERTLSLLGRVAQSR